MEIKIKATEEEKEGVIRAIASLNEIQHIKSMSHNMIAETSGIKSTKVRIVLVDLIEEELIEQFQVSDNKKLQRYYCTITDAGLKYLERGTIYKGIQTV